MEPDNLPAPAGAVEPEGDVARAPMRACMPTGLSSETAPADVIVSSNFPST